MKQFPLLVVAALLILVVTVANPVWVPAVVHNSSALPATGPAIAVAQLNNGLGAAVANHLSGFTGARYISPAMNGTFISNSNGTSIASMSVVNNKTSPATYGILMNNSANSGTFEIARLSNAYNRSVNGISAFSNLGGSYIIPSVAQINHSQNNVPRQMNL